ncbi:MAG: hypothetical protein V4510_10710 [bacterium]
MTSNTQKTLKNVGVAALMTLVGFAAIVTFAPQANAHNCSGTWESDCGGCSSGTHSHSWTLLVPGGCSSWCSDPSACDPGTGSGFGVTMKKLGSVTLNQLAACNENSSFNYYDGGWFAVNNQAGRNYKLSSTPALTSSVSFYQLGSTGTCTKLQSDGFRVPQGTNYILLSADSGEGTAQLLTMPSGTQ